jgi:hypothetical protein
MATSERTTKTGDAIDVTQERNHGAASLFASLNILEVYGAEIKFGMPGEQELRIRREGIRYVVFEMGRHGEAYRYGVGVEIDGRSVRTGRYTNAFESYNEAVNAVIKMIKADPRQSPARY